MPAISVEAIKREFDASVASVGALASEAQSYRFEPSPGIVRRISGRRIEDITTLAVIRLQVSWEAFLEDVFVRYLCGARSTSGYAPVLLNARDSTVAAALARLLTKEKVRFLSWRADSAIKRAGLEFDKGEPFASVLSTAKAALDDMATIRNRSAHASDHAANLFATLVRLHLGYVPRGITPGRFLLTTDPATGRTFFDVYSVSLTVSAASLVP